MTGRWLKDMRAAGIVCAIAAVGLGLGYMAAAGAPGRYLLVNAAALLVGLLLFAAVGRVPERWRGAGLMAAIAIALVATALFGVSADGAARWAKVGPVLLQPSLILLPLLVTTLSRARGPLALAAVLLSAAALAIQPDRAMAGALAASLLALFACARDRWTGGAFVVAAASCGVTLLRPDALPAVPYVDGILYSAFDVHLLAGIAVAGGAALLLAPALAGWRQGRREEALLFAAVWLAIIAAAAIDNYPTPLVGYGSSAVIGYLLSLTGLRGARRATADERGSVTQDGSGLAFGIN